MTPSNYYPELPYWCSYYKLNDKISFPVINKETRKPSGNFIINLQTKFTFRNRVLTSSFISKGYMYPSLDELTMALKIFQESIEKETGIKL